ncbi:MAG TPA: alpha/beta fold hydrolase [Candidatus Limnocylindrales bacterium]
MDPLVVTPSIGATQVADGTNLRTLHWPAVGEPVAAALVVHGLGEHGGRYDNVAEALTEAGIDTHGYDHRGHGGSGGRRNHVERWAQLHDDLAEQVLRVRADHPELPLVLYGHSMGGLICAGYVLSGSPRPLPDLLVLSAPGLDADLPSWKRSLARLLTGVVPKLRIANGLPPGGLSRDPEVRTRADADPLNSSSSTVRFGAEAFDEQDRVNAELARIDAMPVPTYVFHGSADPIVPPRASAVFDGIGNATRHVHDGLRHECHHEPEHEHVLAEVVAWIGRQGVPVHVTRVPHHEADHAKAV